MLSFFATRLRSLDLESISLPLSNTVKNAQQMGK